VRAFLRRSPICRTRWSPARSPSWVPQAGKPCSGRYQRQIKVAQPRATWGMTASARLAW